MKLSYTEKQHAYRIDGVRCKSITTVAKIPEDTYNLGKWQQRQVALGMALDTSLIERAHAHFDDRGAMDDIAEDALRAAKSHESAARGTAIHRVLERHDLGEALIDTPESRALRAAYDKALDAAGLEVVPEYVERIVVYPNERIAGRFDRLLRRRRDGKFVVGDVKSGTGAIKYPHSTALQLGAYANAPLMAGQLPREGGETEQFEKLPEKLDRKWAYIIHTPDAQHVEIVKIDIHAGFTKGWKAAMASLDWRAHDRDTLIQPVGTVDVNDLAAAATAERVDWIKSRLQLITMTDLAPEAKQLVAARWPEGVGRPKDPATRWSEADVDALDEMLQFVEKQCSVAFSVGDPESAAMGVA